MKIILFLILIYEVCLMKDKKNNFLNLKSHYDFSNFKKFYQKNDTLQASLYRDLNTTFVVQDSNKFRKSNRKWDYKILDKQLEQVFATLLWKEQDRMTTNGVRNYMEIFMNEYTLCDKNQDNVLDKDEFISCLKSDKYFSRIVPPPLKYSALNIYTDENKFYELLFKLTDDRYDDYVNFVNYMIIRLMAFSWKHCSVFSPFLEEVDFECALEIVSGTKTSTRNQARNIYKLTLELGNNESMRNIDFITFFIIGSTVRLYGDINGKNDDDITRNEFNLALDNNLLPIRYNQDIINQLYQLIEDYDRPNQGIDLQSFIFYDFVLNIFTIRQKVRPYYVTVSEMTSMFLDPIFPNKTLNEIYMIPQYNLSSESYQMYQYFNISQFVPESDYLYKFLELEVKTSEMKGHHSGGGSVYPGMETGINFYNVSIDVNKTFQNIFYTLDSDLDNYINFYEFCTFMQIAYTFTKKDTYGKGVMTAGDLYEIYKSYAEYPSITYKLRERAERFLLLDQNIYIDLLSATQILKIDDSVKYFLRKTDKFNIYEIELKKLLTRFNMRYIPDTYFHRCLRGIDNFNNIPKYDWECCFIQGMNLNLQYYESMNNYKTAQINNITQLNTVYYNIDPNYQ